MEGMCRVLVSLLRSGEQFVTIAIMVRHSMVIITLPFVYCKCVFRQGLERNAIKVNKLLFGEHVVRDG